MSLSARIKAQLADHWHHHLLILSAIAILLSFTLGAGTAVAVIRHGGYHPGPLPPAIHVPTATGATLPPKWSLTHFIVRVHNQGNHNSCVGQTVSTIEEITHNRQRAKSGSSGSPAWFSAGYVYDQVNGGQDQGASYNDAFEVLRTQGDARYSRFPHDGFDWWVQPDPAAVQDAAAYKIATWRSIDPSDRTTIEYELAHGRPVAIAIPVDSTFYNQWADAHIPTVSSFDPTQVMFWHSMTAVAYGPKGVTLLNSWGPTYGWHGLVRITWSLLASISAGGIPAQVVVSQPAFPPAPAPTPTSQATGASLKHTPRPVRKIKAAALAPIPATPPLPIQQVPAGSVALGA
jgi:hypothetical protein